MQVEIRVDKACASPKVVILTDSVTEEIRQLARRLSGEGPAVLTGFREDTAHTQKSHAAVQMMMRGGMAWKEQ